MASLPGDAELSRLYVLGFTNQEIADRYEVTHQAVHFRLKKIGIMREPIINKANSLIAMAWKVQATREPGSHHQTFPAQSLKAWIRLRLGDDQLSDRQRITAENFEKRLRREGAVLDYDPNSGFSYVPRRPEDGRLALRWPASAEKPSGRDLEVLMLPELLD
ncbi:hypothetical protein P3T27_002104 [Kitasatospora sp. MAA19]|uniref:hypothetical protein n=1 Tax=Kitasatospora sp. MAA19 TaxID=3035090 RepID=UPI0024763ACD|nr:hypothetical protein [Kitasatospora sp. MAA19]MDH6705394.1 hypothetical protein [Kitasatospora sp. MAA19]